MTGRQRGILLASGGMVAISTDSLFTRMADAEAFDITFWVGVFSVGVMLAVIVLYERTTPAALLRRDGSILFLSAALQAAMTTFFVLAVKSTSVSNVVVIILGDLLAMGAVISFGLGVVVLRSHPEMNRPMVVGLGGLVMALVIAVPAQIFGHNAKTWLVFGAMGIVFGPLSRVMLGSAPRYLSAAEVGLFVPIETVLGTLWAFLAFGEVTASQTWIGGAIIMGGLVWGIWPTGQTAAAPS